METTSLHRTVSTWTELCTCWNGPHNFLMTGDCVPFDFEMPDVAQVIDAVRHDVDARIIPGTKGDQLILTDTAETFRHVAIDEALEMQFQMSHFKLDNFYGTGQLFDGFEEQVMDPWRAALSQAGFTWTRCYPILFISGPGAATNYHMDRSHVIAWQRHGTKRFFGLKDPDRWAPFSERILPGGEMKRPKGLTDEETLVYTMQPGDVLWNALLTPHWVEAVDEVTYSINISHGGLRLNNALCKNEQELEDWKLTQEKK